MNIILLLIWMNLSKNTEISMYHYIDKLGRFEMLKFYSDHKAVFPVLWIQSQCEESRRVVEVGCERFFNLADVSSPMRTRLGVRTMSAWQCFHAFFVKVDVDEEWVAQEYLRR